MGLKLDNNLENEDISIGKTKKNTASTTKCTPKEKTVYDGLHEIALSLNKVADAINNNSENAKHVGDKINRLCDVFKGMSNYTAYSNDRVYDA